MSEAPPMRLPSNPLSSSEGEKLFERETQFRKFEVFFDGPVGAIEKLRPVKTARF